MMSMVNLKPGFKFVIKCLIYISLSVLLLSYIFSDYNFLLSSYKNLGCFYGFENFETKFFTLQSKSEGNYFCWLGLILITIVFAISIKYHSGFNWSYFRIERKFKIIDWISLVVITVGGSIIYKWQGSFLHLGYDEVFSALNFAGINVFQAISYYPFPNNHVFFNLINHGLSSFTRLDQVITGKFISLFFYILLMFGNYLVLGKYIRNEIFKWQILLILGTSFLVLGFSSQARGYSMLAFFEWLSFFATLLYLETGDRKFLFWTLISNVLGFWIMPSYLFWIAFLIAFTGIHCLIKGRFNMIYFQIVFFSFILIFLSYLPIICFSGINSIVNNDYVKPVDGGLWQFIGSGLFNNLYTMFRLWFATDSKHLPWFLLLMIFPFILYFINPRFLKLNLLIAFISLFITAVGIIILMKKFPFYRNFIGHGHLVLFIILVSLFSFIEQIKNKKAERILIISSSVISLFFVFHQLRFFRENASFSLYYNDINKKYESLEPNNVDLKDVKTAFVSDNSFYWYYLLKDKNRDVRIDIHNCKYAYQDLVVLTEGDVIDNFDEAHYKAIFKKEGTVLFLRK